MQLNSGLYRTPAAPPSESTPSMRTALIFRERLLAPSETFVVEQARRLSRYRPVLAGLRRTRPSLHYSQPEILLRDGDQFLDRLAASLYRKFPVAPEFFRRLRDTAPSIIHAHFAIDAIQALPIAESLDIPLVVFCMARMSLPQTMLCR